MQDDDTIDIIVGTTKNCILDGSLSSGLGIIVQVQHCSNEIIFIRFVFYLAVFLLGRAVSRVNEAPIFVREALFCIFSRVIS